MWDVFLGVGKGFVWDRGLVCVSGGCVVWNISLVYSCFISMSRIGFSILYPLLYMISVC